MRFELSDRLAGKRVLLLQGPMGPFFDKLDKQLQTKGALTSRVCFNGGDRIFARKDNRVDYRGSTSDWRMFLEAYVSANKVDAMVLYGDCRPYHRIAKSVANGSGIEVFVFEEGYVRPNFITMEQGGVNAHSALPRDSHFYRRLKLNSTAINSRPAVKYGYYRWVFYTIVYFVFMQLWRYRYPHNTHHRNTNIFLEIGYGIRNGMRKLWFALTERKIQHAITNGLSGKYYFVPLQVQYDFQISRHSRFRGMEEFISDVMVSFAKYGPGDACLIYKHHPMDRGRPLFYRYIRKQANKLGISDRVHVMHDVHLPTCLKNAIGTITINSTVGIASLFHGIPTITLGEALYDIEGLTCKGMPLDRFWSEHKAPDRKLFRKFRSYLIEKTQAYGSFYSGFPE